MRKAVAAVIAFLLFAPTAHTAPLVLNDEVLRREIRRAWLPLAPMLMQLGGGIYAEDSAHASGHFGTMVLALRRDTPTSTAGADNDYLPLTTDSAGRLWVNASGGAITGTVTANAGTNLNTSALALESGGNLAGAATSLAVLDDWDETDRAKVNPIVGQAGVAAGSGAVSATTQRVTVATDDVVSVDDNGGALTVDGTVTVTDGAGALNVIVDSGTVAATQSGTWTVQPGNTANTTPWLMSLSEGGVTADIFDLTNSNPLATQIVDANGTAITSFGGGTQYTEGDTDASITGTAMLWEDTSDTLRSVSASKPLPVNVVAGGAGDGAIQDGASSSIEATVFDFTNSNPLAVVLRDTNGDYVSVGGGTQYNQGTATTDTDTLTMSGAVRRDTAAVATGVADGDRLALSTDSAGRLRTTAADTTQPISAASLPLPTGAATAANQDGIIKDGAGDTTQANVSSGRLHVDGSGVTQPVSGTVTVTDGSGALNVIVDSSALPSGAATSANQSTEITSLQKIDNIAHSGSDVALSEHVPISGQFDDASTTTVTENQIAPVRITSGRALHVAPQGTTTVSGTVTANAGTGTMATDPTDEDARVLGRTKIHDGTDTALVSGTGSLQVTCDNCGAASPFEDNDDFVEGTSAVSNVGFLYDDTPTALTDGNAGAARVSSNRNQYTQIRDGAGNERGANVTAANALVVDGSAVTQPVSGTVTVGTFPDNEPINVAQLNGVAVTMGNGASGTGVQRVTIASDSTGQVAVASLPNEGQQTAANSTSVTPDTDNDSVGATGSAVPGEATLIAGTDGTNTTVPYIDPCQREARTVYRVDIVTATTTEIAAAVASEFYWICSINLISAGANNVIIVEDDTATNCPSPTAGVSSGGTTAAEGWNFAANGGIVAGTGANWVMKTGTANRSFCIITSAAVQLSGTITYVSAP